MEQIRRRRIDPEVEHRRGVIVALLHQHPDGLTAREIGEATGIARNLTASALSGLFTRGVLHKRGHRYVLTSTAMEEGTLSIVQRDRGYQVRYASNDPRAPDHQPYGCHDEATLVALLHQLGTEPAAITQACATVRQGGVAVLYMRVSLRQRQAFFRPTS